ncbi:hypothetical protein Tco_0220438, partial [Tanacetum coccineum]
SAYTISIHSQCFYIVKLYLYKLAITLSMLQRSVQFGTHTGSTSYAKLVTGETSRKSVNFRTLITPAENRTNVVVPLESSQAVRK